MSHSASVRARTAPGRSPGRAVRSPAPPGPRRVSGPVRRPLPAAAGSVGARPAGRARRNTSPFDRIRALPDHRLIDGLLRSQAWIWVIGIALGGIVAMQVSLLKLNSGIGRAVESSATLERQNAALELSVARLSSGQRLERTAVKAGMIMPAAGTVRYVRPRPDIDPRWAAMRMLAPTPAARLLMANGGVVPSSPPATPALSDVAPVTATTASPGAAAAGIAAPAATAPTQAPAGTAPATAAPDTAAPAPAAPVSTPAASVPPPEG